MTIWLVTYCWNRSQNLQSNSAIKFCFVLLARSWNLGVECGLNLKSDNRLPTLMLRSAEYLPISKTKHYINIVCT